MPEKKFSCQEALKFAWKTVQNNLGFFLGLMILLFLIFIPLNILTKQLEKSAPLTYYISTILISVLSMVIAMGTIKISLKFCDNQKGEFNDLFSCAGLFFNYLASHLLYGLIIIGGFILLIVPGIIWAIKFQFFGYFIVDKGMGPIEALKQSAAITRDAKWDLFVFWVLLALINIAGMLALLVGLLVAIPVSMVATAFVFRKLQNQSQQGVSVS